MPSRLSRLIQIIRIIRRKGFPGVPELCHTLGVKERTLFNDLKELKEDLGVDIQFDRSRSGYYFVSDPSDMHFISLTEETALLLLGAFDLMSCYGGNAFVEPLRQAFADEINACLKGISTDSRMETIMRMDCKQNTVEKDLLLGLYRACLKSESVKIAIRNEGWLSVKPSHMVFSADEWWLKFRENGHAGAERPLSIIENLKSNG